MVWVNHIRIIIFRWSIPLRRSWSHCICLWDCTVYSYMSSHSSSYIMQQHLIKKYFTWVYLRAVWQLYTTHTYLHCFSVVKSVHGYVWTGILVYCILKNSMQNALCIVLLSKAATQSRILSMHYIWFETCFVTVKIIIKKSICSMNKIWIYYIWHVVTIMRLTSVSCIVSLTNAFSALICHCLAIFSKSWHYYLNTKRQFALTQAVSKTGP